MPNAISVTDNTYVVAADGVHAKTFRVTVRDQEVSLHAVAEMEPQNLLSQGPSGVRPPEQSSEQKDEATFAKQLGNLLNAKVVAGDIDALVLMADPQTLGQLRGVISAETKRCVVAEVDKRVTDEPLEVLTRRFEAK